MEIEELNCPSPACAGDIDGDGEMEVVHVGYLEVVAFEADGTRRWTVGNDDPGGMTGCTTFDFDLDGAKEIVHTNENAIRILDGRTGEVLWEDLDWFTNTVLDVPLIADLDGDGSVELIVPSNGGPGYGNTALRVYRNVNRDWPPGGPIWPSAAWSGTSLYADGTVPRHPDMPWETTRVWRGQPEVFLTGSDVRVEVVDHCVSSCDLDAQVQLALRIVNGGPEEVHRPVPVAGYTVDADGTRRLAEVVTFDDFLEVGHASATRAMRLTTREVQPGFALVAGDDGTGAVTIDDCEPEDNETAWTLDECAE
jgi:hypothetical protein